MSKEEILQAGIAAARLGDTTKAASLFAQVVKIDPSSEQGWLWLGKCCSAPDQREYCFRRVLALNPNNLDARQQLQPLSKPVSPPARVSQSPQAETANVPKPAPPVAPPVAPIKSFDESVSVVEDELPSPATTETPLKTDAAKKSASQRKKRNNALFVLLGFVPTLIICGVAGAYLFLSGQMTRLLSPGLPAIQTPLPPAAITITPSAASSPTPAPPTAIPSPIPTVSYTPLFENAPCQFESFGSVDVNCGYLIVPEDRTGDPSHTIRLAVAVYKSTGDNPEPEPVMFLQGGPGAEAVQLSADAYSVLVYPFLAKHDFIVFDQRGTGISEPALGCEELTKTYSQDIHGLIPGSTRKLVYSNAFLSCNGLMSAQGVNLNAYTTVASAADIKDLLAVLGYQKANLYGASYGTRLAQVVMRDYPEIVHTAILDSVVPVESSLFSRYPNAIESGLKTLFINCAVDPECNAAYPDLEVVFWDLVSRLDANPVTVTTSNYPTGTITETVTGTTVMNVVLGSIKNSRFISTAPQSIYRFKNGDFSTLIIEQSSLPFMFEGISPGLFITMMCHEHVLATTPEEVQTASSRQIIKDYAWLPFYGNTDDVFKTCKSWGATSPLYGENAPTVSDIPSLIITGAYDPTTPPMYAKQIAGQLSHNYYFEFPGLGHTPTAADSSGCAMDIVLEFLDDPYTEPDRACLNEMKKVDFIVPYAGNPPFSLKTVQANGITVDVPEDWRSIGGGFYYRGNSPFDITEVGILQVSTNSEDIESWFSLEAYGYRGLDGPLIAAGKRQANGLTWTLYTSSSYGRPVDIAMADYRGWSLVVALFCNSDEHDALYRTVFLPMVDSANP